MPTLIDELIVSLSIDSTGFKRGKEQAESELRQLGRTAETGAAAVEDNVGRVALTVVGLLEAIGKPTQAIERGLHRILEPSRMAHRQLGNVADQGRKTGDAIAHGADTGAFALRGIAGAALIAYTAISLLDKGMKAAVESAHEVFQASVGAKAAGMPVSEFSAVAQALQVAGNVPLATTAQWLAHWKQMQEGIAQGLPEDVAKLPALARAGVDYNASGEQTLQTLAGRYANEPAAAAVRQGALIGLDETSVIALRKLGAGFPAAVERERRRSITDRDVTAATDLTKAVNDMELSWDKLGRSLLDTVDPTLTRFLHILAALADVLNGDWGDAWHEMHGDTEAAPGEAAPRAHPGGSPKGGGRNNPGNLRVPGSTGTGPGAFQSFATPEAGVAAIGSQLDRYEARGINTLSGIISTWAPPNENPTRALIANAARRTGLDPNQRIDMHDPTIRQKVIDALIVQEQGYLPPKYAHAGKSPSGQPDALDRTRRWLWGPNYDQIHAAVTNAGNMVEMARAAQGGGNVTTNSRGDTNHTVNVHTGPISIATASTDPRAVGRSLADSLRNNLDTASANTG